jgi:hypothetical protein
LKRKYDEPLSKFAFKLSSRRYTAVMAGVGLNLTDFGRAVHVDGIKTRVESAPGFSA